MKVLITPRGFANYGLDQVKYMESKGLSVHYNNTGKQYTKEEFHKLAADADAIIVGVDIIDRELMEKCPKLKAICKFGVGTDNIDLDYAKEKGIFVGRTVGSNSQAVAEHVIALMLAESKNLYCTIKEVKEHKWNKPTVKEISGKILGIIGFGMIGKKLANFANGMSMKVYAYDAFGIPDKIAKECNVEKKSFEEIISESDYISLHVPLLDSTKHMISTEQFKKMKKDACLINAARGEIVDEKALYGALANNEIRSACFDVYSSEPPKFDDNLTTLDNFFLTPHIAARTVESEKRTCKMSSKIIVKSLMG
ncbi:phosphoglycerate dehydrogenase [Clostridium sp.]|uniref:phosphoglycerate dehydrogenase n=1 Tax=Clostridium sp. TaxID=1506 RepID=UPI0025B80C2A|nr:phosphoglycerate dehydrogenase [Clostridium sp.]MCI1717256.1 phosphoglycerate dehydrogenase [Clostridium sp.]MCI1801596.1 phosphoglycerate dehydrogenase [Clostridium sp.]MCI1815442.1 phosphoglycerate dehydrogenase [Clostridium sp.]MCI1872345.1 phosphoglycerate dehydrogenase [Clostridium sp.]